MHLIQLHNVGVNHAGTTIFRDLNWAIGDRDRVAWSGPNGAGKSSLLRVVAGEATPERGTVTRMGGVSSAILAQDVTLPAARSGRQRPCPRRNWRAARRTRSRRSAPRPPGSTTTPTRSTRRWRRSRRRCYATNGSTATSTEPRARTAGAARLHARRRCAADRDVERRADEAGRAGPLAAWSPDVLLLDEPDNHLDLKAKALLEAFIRAYRGAVVVVSHDRYLLDEVVTHIAELDEGKLTVYPGNYSDYAVEREAAPAAPAAAVRAQQREIARIEARIKEWDIEARVHEDERSARQAASRRKMLARMEANGEIIERVTSANTWSFSSGPTGAAPKRSSCAT